MGIVSKMKERWKLMKEYDIKDLVKNIDLHARVNVNYGQVIVRPSTDKKYWKIIDTLNKLNIDYETFKDRWGRGIEIIILRKRHRETFEDEESDEEPDIFNSEGGFDL
jgi:hypothetical protein